MWSFFGDWKEIKTQILWLSMNADPDSMGKMNRETESENQSVTVAASYRKWETGRPPGVFKLKTSNSRVFCPPTSAVTSLSPWNQPRYALLTPASQPVYFNIHQYESDMTEPTYRDTNRAGFVCVELVTSSSKGNTHLDRAEIQSERGGERNINTHTQ